MAALGATVRGDRVVSLSTTAGEISPGDVIFATGGPPKIYGMEIGRFAGAPG